MDKYAKQDKRIVFFDATLQSGGAERVISILTNHLLTNGYQVEVLLYHDQPIFYTMPTGLKITSVEHETGSSNIHKNICWMRQFFKQHADIVISFLAPFNMLALVSHLGLKSKIIVADRNDPRHIPSNWLWRKMRDILYRGANAVVVQTKRNREYFSKYIQAKTSIIYNPVDGMCIWQKLTTDTIERTNHGDGKGFFVKIPMTQVFLNEASNTILRSFSNLPEHITNYNFLLSQKKFMEIIQDGGIVKLHSTEWVNKSSGRGATELIVDDGNSIQKYSYPYWFPFTPYTDVFPRLFPWADFSADEDYFFENDESLWRELNCYYDKEEHEWLVVGDSFEEFRNKLDPMRCIDNSGEVAEYMMILSLNDLGKAFLQVGNFVSQNRPYSDARPVEEK